MPGYRFCRSDDIPLLVAAHNACWVPHFGPASAITIDDFKRGVRELGLWSSSCMVAFEGDEPIGLLLAAKRDGEANWVWRLAVKPGWEGRGHGRHLLTSLADKAKILGPARVAAEIPAASTAVRRFFARSGFALEAHYADFVLDPPPPNAPAPHVGGADLVTPITLDELIESGAFDVGRRRAWGRTAASLRGRAAVLEGLAVATDRIEAYVLAAPSPDGTGRDVVALGAEPGPSGRALVATLVAMVRPPAGALRIPMVHEEEVGFATLAELGFRRAGDVVGYATGGPA